jgi:hypothetical protein
MKEPISEIKWGKAMRIIGLDRYPVTAAAIKKEILFALASDPPTTKYITGRILAIIIYTHLHAQNRLKAELSFEDDCIWVGRDIYKLIPLEYLKKYEMET